mgnify:CR=1 FL=1
MKRISISVSDWQLEGLTEVARLEESSVAQVARDCIRGVLPGLLEVTRFLHDPHTTSEGALTLANDMERVMAKLSTGAAGSDEVADAAPPRRFRNRIQPPSSNTGAKYPENS